MSFASACQEWELAQKKEMMEATWGHLAPAKNKAYVGHIVWALDLYDSGYLNPKVLECDLKGLHDSPWFYDAMIEFLQAIHEQMFSSHRDSFWGASDREKATAGTLWRWDGTFHNYKFKGTVRQLFCEGLGKPAPVAQRTKMTKKDFERIAGEIRVLPAKQRDTRAHQACAELKLTNPLFNAKKFLQACGILV
jgi:hypothetical protein